MDDLATFLRARLDEDEAAAKLVSQPYRLYVSSEGRIAEPMRVEDWNSPRDGEYASWADGEDRMPNHIANWSLIYDPARVLRAVEAKRRVISRVRYHADIVGKDEVHGDILRAMAQEYADHPEFRSDWKV